MPIEPLATKHRAARRQALRQAPMQPRSDHSHSGESVSARADPAVSVLRATDTSVVVGAAQAVTGKMFGTPGAAIPPCRGARSVGAAGWYRTPTGVPRNPLRSGNSRGLGSQHRAQAGARGDRAGQRLGTALGASRPGQAAMSSGSSRGGLVPPYAWLPHAHAASPCQR
jgi:hypothetical protein